MSNRSIILNESSRRRRGIALILVLLVMAVASILAFAMLSASALQATASSNAITAAAAQAQAESGIHLAAYYLTHPMSSQIGSEWAALSSGQSWTSPAPISFSSTQPSITTMSGSVSMTIMCIGVNEYSVTAIGSVPSATDGQAITRTITASLEAIPSYEITGAGELNSNATADASVTVNGSGGNSLVSSGIIKTMGGSVNPAAVSGASIAPAPATGTITDYSQPYYYQGVLYYPVQIGNTISTTQKFESTPENPLGIYYCSGNLTVTTAGSLTVIGTLYVKGGNLVDESTMTVSTSTGSLPSLVVDQSLKTLGGTANFTATGVVCTDDGITATGSGNITINGALLVTNNGGSNAINNGSAQVNLTYNSIYTNILNLTTSEPPAIKVISWSEEN